MLEHSEDEQKSVKSIIFGNAP